MALEIFTSANLEYLPQASVLAESVKRYAPDARFTLVLVDAFPAEDSPHGQRLRSGLFDEILISEDLLGEAHDSWIFGYDVVAACTALKGRALLRLLEREQPVLYLDPDTALFGPLSDVENALGEASVLLTPHLLDAAALDSHAVDQEISTLAHGIYNFGMFGVSPCEEGIRFAEWWASRLEKHCVDDIARGLFVDQRWGDLIPPFFPNSLIFRHAGFNFASWNMHQRHLSIDDLGDYRVNDDPLVMYHFTKGLGIGFEISKLAMSQNPLVADLWRWYLERVDYFSKGIEPQRWSYGFYRDGSRVRDQERSEWRSLAPEERPNDPFDRVLS